ncbi:MAG TPA: amino acid permease [Ktedonobacteraceae bacterium]|jgi:amino acid transporter|nr:amino acid permease [Ktedonobacteraceae bacterium]
MSLAENQHDYADEVVKKYGYRQEFRREIKRFASFAVGFSFISITTGIFTTYGTILNSSGPLGIWTWPLVIVGQLFVALVFAALASRIPLAGYSYQWVSRLANPKVGWLIGWISFVFLIIDVVAVDYAVAQTVLPSLFGYTETPQNAWLATAIVILIQMVLILVSTLWTTRINNAAVATELIGIIGLTLLLIIVGAIRGLLHGDHLFTTGMPGANGPVFNVPFNQWFTFGGLNSAGPFLFAFLLGAFTIVGFEAAANLAEETTEAHRVVPNAMWTAVVLSGIVGFVFLMALNLASQDLGQLAGSATPVANIVTGVLGQVVGDIFLVFVAFSIFACGLVIFITASRLTWAMSRDERFPGYRLFGRVNPQTGTPVAATLLCGILIEAVLAVFAYLGIAVPSQSNTLFSLFSAATLLPAIIYLATVILYIYARRKLPETHGFRLGAWEWPVIILALVWLLFELSIFRDSSFAAPWLYSLIMFALGLIYFAWMFFTRPKALQTVPEPGHAGEVA